MLEANLNRCQWLDRIGERDSSLLLLNRTLSQAENLGNANLIASTRLGLIRHFARYQLRDSLEKNLDPLIEFSEKNNLPKIKVEAMLFKAGHLLETQRFRPAMDVCDSAIELAQPLADKHLEGLCLLYKGSVMRTVLNDTRPPLPYLYRALEIFEAVGDTANMIRANLLIMSGHPEEAKKLEFFGRAEALGKFYPSETTRMTLLNNKSSLVELDAAVPLLREALKISNRLRIPNMTQHLYFQLTQRYAGLEQYNRALGCLDSALAAFPGNVPDDIGLYYYDIYRSQGDFEKAVAAMERYRKNEDERKLAQTKSFVAEWETKLNIREKEWELQQQQKELKNQQTRNLLLGAILLLTLLAGGGMCYAFYKQRKARRLLARQNETIRRQSEELQSLEKLKSRFFANVSHELRTPLTLMLAPVHSLLKRKAQDGEERKLLQFIQRNAQQLQKLINEILDLSKLENHKLEVLEEPVHFYSYLKEQLAQFNSAAMSNELEFRLNFQVDKQLSILLDKSKFEKIVHNFLSNAMKFTTKGDQVNLTVEELGDALQLTVGDTGRGIHPDDLPHVFDRFYQSKQPDAPTEGGTGIGLSLVKELAELLGGQVWAESELGKGSTFYFKFPKKEALEIENGELRIENEEISGELQHVAVEANTILNSPFSILNSPTILIVEDNPDLREYLRFLLSDYHVLTAENGEEALEILNEKLKIENESDLGNSQFPVDLIISDLMMPVMDGFQFLEKVKSDDRWRHLPFIMLTAKVNSLAKLNALRIGVDDYLTKPFKEEELKARIENLLRNYRERLAFFSQTKMELGEEAPGTEKPIIAAVDAEWLEAVEKVFYQHLSDTRLNVDFAANKLNLSERQFHRRLKQLTGLTPNQYLQEIRLQRAKDFLLTGSFATVKEAAFAVGFQDARYFSELFEKHFGAKPSEMRK